MNIFRNLQIYLLLLPVRLFLLPSFLYGRLIDDCVRKNVQLFSDRQFFFSSLDLFLFSKSHEKTSVLLWWIKRRRKMTTMIAGSLGLWRAPFFFQKLEKIGLNWWCELTMMLMTRVHCYSIPRFPFMRRTISFYSLFFPGVNFSLLCLSTQVAWWEERVAPDHDANKKCNQNKSRRRLNEWNLGIHSKP